MQMELSKNVKPADFYGGSKTNSVLNNKLTLPRRHAQECNLLAKWQPTTNGLLAISILKRPSSKGEENDLARDFICQLPPDSCLPSHLGARLKKPAYGMNDAPRRWWNRIDGSRSAYGMVPTRADRCLYMLDGKKSQSGEKQFKDHNPPARTETNQRPLKRTADTTTESTTTNHDYQQILEDVMNQILDPIEGSAAYNMEVLGVVALHVDDLLMTGSPTFHSTVVARLRKDYQVGSEDKDDIVFTGQRLRWLNNAIVMDQDKAVEELSEIQVEKKLNDEADCTPAMHTE
jgi:hypothetical protein